MIVYDLASVPYLRMALSFFVFPVCGNFSFETLLRSWLCRSWLQRASSPSWFSAKLRYSDERLGVAFCCCMAVLYASSRCDALDTPMFSTTTVYISSKYPLHSVLSSETTSTKPRSSSSSSSSSQSVPQHSTRWAGYAHNNPR